MEVLKHGRGKENASPEVVKQGVPPLPHRGFNPTACLDIWLATFHTIEMLYETPFPAIPQTDHTPEKADRNAEISARYEQGESLSELAAEYGISEQRVSQILRGQRK